jgi:hypothetical protein
MMDIASSKRNNTKQEMEEDEDKTEEMNRSDS